MKSITSNVSLITSNTTVDVIVMLLSLNICQNDTDLSQYVVSNVSAGGETPLDLLYVAIKVILIVVHCPTQDAARPIFHSAALMPQSETVNRKTAFLRFTEICLCLMQFKATQSYNPSPCSDLGTQTASQQERSERWMAFNSHPDSPAVCCQYV